MPGAAPRRHPEGRVHPRQRRVAARLVDPWTAVRGLADPRRDRGAVERRDPRRRRPSRYRPAVWRSEDDGRIWTRSSEGLSYGGADRDGDGPTPIATIWSLATGPDGTVYAGVEPAGLFRGADGGRTWAHVEGLTNHSTRPHLATRRRRADPSYDRPPSVGPRSDVGRHLRGRRLPRHATPARAGAAEQGRARRLRPRAGARDRPVRPQVRDGRG